MQFSVSTGEFFFLFCGTNIPVLINKLSGMQFARDSDAIIWPNAEKKDLNCDLFDVVNSSG